ncbi:MAG: TlyA family RNA methyltransferase [Sulfurospirillaceae bacterium]|nr:TlyA family RNA methyltransferase [Sulfurospirillaceae bacterium]MDD2825886.1 TlyA family RNA methyltransferase [Sulfurospirillaceae bacterium]
MRLDAYLFDQRLAQSRNKAAELIKAGSVFVNGVAERKSSVEIKESDEVTVEKISQYVSRSGHKLKGFFGELKSLHVEGLSCLDIGSSTGGFVEVLLEEGAKSVTAVDVGSAQLHEMLRLNPRVVLFENTDIRVFNPKITYDMVTCDVSFIGVAQILNDIDRLANKGIIILFKPQFEVGKEVKRTTKGVVKDASAILRAQQKIESECVRLGWTLMAKRDSLLKGKEGNAETFYYFEKR